MLSSVLCRSLDEWSDNTTYLHKSRHQCEVDQLAAGLSALPARLDKLKHQGEVEQVAAMLDGVLAYFNTLKHQCETNSSPPGLAPCSRAWTS